MHPFVSFVCGPVLVALSVVASSVLATTTTTAVATTTTTANVTANTTTTPAPPPYQGPYVESPTRSFVAAVGLSAAMGLAFALLWHFFLQSRFVLDIGGVNVSQALTVTSINDNGRDRVPDAVDQQMPLSAGRGGKQH